jgi:hypothetical protein
VTGVLPSAWGALTALTTLYLSYSKLQGSLPTQ